MKIVQTSHLENRYNNEKLCSTSESYESSSSECSDEELNMHMNECDCTNSDNCKCESSTESEISSNEDHVSQPKEKFFMAQTMDDAKMKLVAQIRKL